MSSKRRGIFPLKTVLFPGAVMQLVIFEPRYLDLVSRCMSEQIPFVISRMTAGREVGSPAEFEAIGTFAHIVDFDKRDDGVLTIKVRGGERVCILEHQVQADRLIVSEHLQILPSVRDHLLPDSVAALRELVTKLAKLPEVDIDTNEVALDSCEYVVHQLAQLLPIDLDFKQYLLEEQDAEHKAIALFNQLLDDSEAEQDDLDEY
ncbi:LON peptidase substrate-binding domain-containing protein [Pleionea litopenaei]|uniref:LON peptidase substrate-binding domain-containing protein n=1 Tax=Pleionea litopenaei TaxID=3070815 RepID=A0AA51X6D2_9GAMM|nr:LON peptidase substrate-binding domain-containing protein [Pleionea sp. HL-JVS1]WMS87172.1 LON peptidase substrate-binding domain-containing protein [Pleionea sp. HL-JVS1]